MKSSLRQVSTDPQCPYCGACHLGDGLTLPGIRLQSRARGGTVLEFHTAPFHRNPKASPDAGLVLAFRLWLGAAPCPGRVLALSLSANCYASYDVQLSYAEFQLHRLVAECSTTKARTSLSRVLIGQP